MAQECTKRFNEKVNLRRHSILHLRAHLRFHFTEHLKMHKIMKKKMYFTLQLKVHLTVSSKGVPEGNMMVHLRMHLGASIKMLKRVHVRLQ